MKHLDKRFFLNISGGNTEAEPIRVNEINGYSVTAEWGAKGGRTGVLKLQASNDYFMRYQSATSEDPQEIMYGSNPGATWVDIAGSTKVVDATADSHLWNVSETFYAVVRLVWVGTGGGGTDDVKAVIHGQGYSL